MNDGASDVISVLCDSAVYNAINSRRVESIESILYWFMKGQFRDLENRLGDFGSPRRLI